jgi:hypothetical protein
MGSTITVTILMSQFGERIVAQQELPRWIVEQTFCPIDLPDPSISDVAAILCESSVKIESVMKTRNEIAERLSQTLTKLLLDAMGAKDTRMGYPQPT